MTRWNPYEVDATPPLPQGVGEDPPVEAPTPAFQWVNASYSSSWTAITLKGILHFRVEWATPVLESWPQVNNRGQENSIPRRMPGSLVDFHLVEPQELWQSEDWFATVDIAQAADNPAQLQTIYFGGGRRFETMLIARRGHLRWCFRPAPRYYQVRVILTAEATIGGTCPFGPVTIGCSVLPTGVTP